MKQIRLAAHCSTRFLAALLLLACANSFADIQPLDRIAAVVNDEVLMSSEVNNRVQMFEYDLKQRGTQLPPRTVLQQQVLERMVLEEVQLQRARQTGIRIDDQALNESMEKIARENGLSLEGFRYALEAEGLSFAEAREQVRREMAISRLRQERVWARIQVTPQEISNFLASDEGREQTSAEYNLAHILIPLSEEPTAAETQNARALASNTHQQLLDGADFAEVVNGSGGNLRGGSLGWRKTSELPSIFADAVPALKAGEVSAPIRSESGFHIIRLNAIRGGEMTFVQETKVRHILIQPSEIRTDAEARELAMVLRKRIRNGEDFEELARAFSDDNNSARNGGDLGWLQPGETVREFETVMNNIIVGQLSQPFKSSFGWHVLQVMERRDTNKSDEFRTMQARNILRNRKFEEALSNWLAEIRDEAYVEVKI